MADKPFVVETVGEIDLESAAELLFPELINVIKEQKEEDAQIESKQVKKRQNAK